MSFTPDKCCPLRRTTKLVLSVVTTIKRPTNTTPTEFLTSAYPVVNRDFHFSSRYRPLRTLKMVASIDKILKAMPHSYIPPIIGQPTYSSIHEIHQFLNSNAASIQFNLGCGTMGFIYLTLLPTVYATLSATLFIPPPKPDATATIPSTATASQTSSIRQAHNEAQEIFKEYYNTDKALTKAPHRCCWWHLPPCYPSLLRRLCQHHHPLDAHSFIHNVCQHHPRRDHR